MQRQACQRILWVCLSLLCQQMCTVTSRMQTFHFHLPVCAEFYHRAHLESKLVSVSTRLQYRFSPPFQQARSKLQPLHTPLLVRIPEQEHFNMSHRTSETARWNCSWKGIWWPCPKQYKDFGFYCWRGKTTNFFILVLEHSPVVLSRLWSLCLNSTHEYTCVCVCVCMHMYKNIWRVSSFQKIWAHVCLYIVGLNLALRYCVYLAAVSIWSWFGGNKRLSGPPL